MANRHTDDATDEARRKGDVTDEIEDGDGTGDGHVSSSRRSLLKGAAATAATLGSVGALTRGATAQQGFTATPSGEVTIAPGEYSWDSEYMEIPSDSALIGGGNPGDVVLNLGRTMEGTLEGRLENVVIRGANPESTASMDLHPGATVDGFIWPKGGQQDRDRAFYTPEGGNDRVTVRNSAWAFNVNNGAYCDKPPMTFENCAAVNNNISQIRIGHREGTDVSKTSYVRNCLIAVTREIPNDSVNSSNGRGVRIRHPGNFVIENCWFIYLDVHGSSSPIVFHDEAEGASVTIRNCKFYNETDNPLLRDKTGGNVDVTVENCVAVGGGSTEFEAGGVGESDLAASGDVSFPLPSDVTGYAAADDIEGVGSGIGPWSGSVPVSTEDEEGNESSGELDHTLVMHSSPENPAGATEVSFVVDGQVTAGDKAEEGEDVVQQNNDGTTAVTSTLRPDGLDSFNYSGTVVDYKVPDGYQVDISVDGTTTTFEELVNGGSSNDNGDSTDGGNTGDGGGSGGSVFEVVAQSMGDLYYEFEVDGDVEMLELNNKIRAGHGDSVDSSGETTIVTGFTGNTGYGDAYRVHGEVLRFEVTKGDIEYVLRLDGETVSFDGGSGDGSGDGSSGDGSNDGGSGDGSTKEYPHLLTVTGTGTGTQYTFTVSGDVRRDEQASKIAADSMAFDWDSMEDIAKDGKVIGVVGSGVDAYRFSGRLTAMTVDGDAEVSVARDA